MCDSNVGVARKIDLESVSADVAKLIRKLDKELEGSVKVADVKKIEAKLAKIVGK